MTDVVDRLCAAGMSAREAMGKARLYATCRDVLRAMGHRAEDAAFYVPGRIEVLGKHTDYAGGRSLLCAVERGFVTLVVPRADAAVRVVDAARHEPRELALDPDLEVPWDDWSAYVAVTLRRLARNFPDARRGADIAFASDLPPAAGMSSSSALGVSIFLALDAVNGYSSQARYREAITSPEELAAYLGCVENGQSFGPLEGDRGVGTFGGSEDHTAMLCCRAGVISRYAFSPIRAEGEIPLPSTLAFVVAHSGVSAEKGGGAQSQYNELSLVVRRILELWKGATDRADDSLAAAVESGDGAEERIREIIRGDRAGDFAPDRLLERFDQFVIESYEIIPAAAEALSRGDIVAFGELVDRSQRGAEALLRNQTPETMALARLARGEGALAASAFGAGFGGSVWALVDAAVADAFLARWRGAYRLTCSERATRADFIVTRPGPGSTRLHGRPGRVGWHWPNSEVHT